MDQLAMSNRLITVVLLLFSNVCNKRSGNIHNIASRLALVLTLVTVLLCGCATDSSSPIPKNYNKSERQLELELWGTEAIPNDEKILYQEGLYQIKPELLNTTICGWENIIRGGYENNVHPLNPVWRRMIITDKSTYVLTPVYRLVSHPLTTRVTYVAANTAMKIVETWNYVENPIAAELQTGDTTKNGCLNITDSNGEKFRYYISHTTGWHSKKRAERLPRIINYLVEQAESANE